MTNSDERLALRRAVLNITSRCNLKCKLCVTGCPTYKKPPHYSFQFLSDTISRFFSIVDYVEWYEFSGGEPFLHEGLSELIEYLMQYKKQFDKLLIITNGSIMPSKTVVNVLSKYAKDILVFISDYGDISVKTEELTELLTHLGIEHKVKKYHGSDQHFNGWVDYGNWEKRNNSIDELKEKYKRCGATKMQGIFTTHAGTMHWCVRSAKGLVVDRLISDSKQEYIDLFDDTLNVDKQREKIKRMLSSPFISACDFCDGDGDNNVKRYPAAEQIERQI